MKIAGYNLGCKVNKYELEAILEDFEKHGNEIVDFEETADVYIISTCAVTALAEKKSRKYINRTKKKNPNAITVALGCYIQKEINVEKNVLDEELLKNIDIFIGSNHKNEIRQLVEEFASTRINKTEKLENNIKYEKLNLSKTYGLSRAYVKIQDGCNNFCSYCIIPYVRGRERSRDMNDIISEIKDIASRGIKEVILTGIEVAAYGKDLKRADSTCNVTLIDVIKAALSIEGIERVRLSSLEQSIITEEFIELFKNEDRLCRHFHLSLQSGSTTVLKRMNRKYTADEYFTKVKMIKESLPDATITTDIIVGFPEETDIEFNETCDFARKAEFGDIHIFPYSVRTGTRAASMPQLKEFIKADRAKELEKVKYELIDKHLNKFIGKVDTVLIEQSHEVIEDGAQVRYLVGHTKNFIKVNVKSDIEDYEGKILKVKLVEIKGNEVVGEIWEE